MGNLEKNTHKKILKNQIKISKKLDLHGRSVEESKIAVFKFITIILRHKIDSY